MPNIASAPVGSLTFDLAGVCLEALLPEVEAVKGPKPELIVVGPPPTWARAARGPTLVRIPDEEPRTRTPGAIRALKLDPTPPV